MRYSKESLKENGLISSRKLRNNVRENILLDNTREIKYHDTTILSFRDDTITLNNGGFFTKSTKDNFNRFLPMKYYIFQRNFKWYIRECDSLIKKNSYTFLESKLHDYFNGIVLKV